MDWQEHCHATQTRTRAGHLRTDPPAARSLTSERCRRWAARGESISPSDAAKHAHAARRTAGRCRAYRREIGQLAPEGLGGTEHGYGACVPDGGKYLVWVSLGAFSPWDRLALEGPQCP